MKTTTKKSASKDGRGAESAAKLIDAKIEGLIDWRGKTLARIRKIIKQADPDVVEEWKCSGLVSRWNHLQRRDL